MFARTMIDSRAEIEKGINGPKGIAIQAIDALSTKGNFTSLPHIIINRINRMSKKQPASVRLVRTADPMQKADTHYDDSVEVVKHALSKLKEANMLGILKPSDLQTIGSVPETQEYFLYNILLMRRPRKTA